MTTTAILLAAGHGTRLGQDKPTFELNGESLVRRHVRQARAAHVDHFVIVANPANTQAVYEQARPAVGDVPLTVVLQEGPDAHAAALTGLRRLSADCEQVFVSGITDIVPDTAYEQVAAALPGGGIAIASAVLERTFTGGMLGFHPGSTTDLACIIERPEGGCPPGHLVNIWVHHISGRQHIERITELTAHHRDYEDAVNDALAAGTPGTAVVLPWWEAIKDPASVQRAYLLLDPPAAPAA
ncbi:nucleotidyltransferase family protein [Kitasatospora sp. NPDC048545]|uniref:nucleotidyltransferase family protein n=1 Tax=Kitasatospora sp. NPDC048545 TaxID=3157208 RepID=UPI0033C528D0